MATSKEFVDQLKKDIQAFPKIRIKHPFLKAVCAGTATMDQIRAWAIVSSTATCMSPAPAPCGRYASQTTPPFSYRPRARPGRPTGSGSRLIQAATAAPSIST